MGELLRKWTGRLAKPYVQGIIRKLSRSQIEGMIPPDLSACFVLEEQHDGTTLVIAKDHEQAPTVLQTICDADWEETLIERQLEADREVGSSHRDDYTRDAVGTVSGDRSLGKECLFRPQSNDLKLPRRDDEHVADGELAEVRRERRDDS